MPHTQSGSTSQQQQPSRPQSARQCPSESISATCICCFSSDLPELSLWSPDHDEMSPSCTTLTTSSCVDTPTCEAFQPIFMDAFLEGSPYLLGMNQEISCVNQEFGGDSWLSGGGESFLVDQTDLNVTSLTTVSHTVLGPISSVASKNEVSNSLH